MVTTKILSFLTIIFAITYFSGAYNYLSKESDEIDKLRFYMMLSILSPITLFIITFFTAGEVDMIIKYDRIFPRDLYFEYFNPFNWDNTWWVWSIFLIIIVLIEIKLFSIRKSFKHLKNILFMALFYLSFLSTVIGSIAYLLIVNIQLNSLPGRSTRDWFLLYAFFYCYILPIIFWFIYYVAIKNNDSIKAFFDRIRQKRDKQTNYTKKKEAINELKEAKELLNLGIISKVEFDNLSKKLKPLILGVEK